MKKQMILLPILLAFVLLFPIDVSAASYFSDEMISFGRDAAQESVQAEDGFVLIPGGTFQMGSPAGEPERSLDEIPHSVTVRNFYMAKSELSQEDYEAVMGMNPSVTKGSNLPVTNITWYDAVQYCNKRSTAEGLIPCYRVSGTTVTWNKAANGYRLPTEAEWEYAARAATTTPFHFGDYVHNSDANCYNAYGYNNDASGSWVNGSDAYLRRPVEVDRYPANAYGLYNMHGNAAEWVWDWYGAYDSGAVENPCGPENGNAKIVRGGGWNDHPKHIRSAYRGAQPADVGLYSIGIRLVRSAGETDGEARSVYDVKAEQRTGRTLIVYFSQTGNTEGLANLIHEISGADIFRLERRTPYSSSSNGPVLYGEALDELRAEAVPELKAYPDTSQYDTVLLGYCNWWSSIPASVRSFLLHDDFSGKTIVPFCSMGGGHFGQTISAIAKLVPESVIREGLEVTYSSYDRNEISAWLEKSLPVQGEDEGSSLPGDKICEHSYRTDIVPATARRDGSITRICVFCGMVESRSVIPQAESLKLSKTSYTYNGKLKKPDIMIEDSQGRMLTEGKDYTLVYPNHAKDPGIYKVAARFKGNYSGIIEGSFSIKPKAIAISKISQKKGGFLLKWKKQKKTLSGYEISYSTNRKFTKNTTRSVMTGKGIATSKSVSKLKTGQRYYVRIRAFRTLNVDGKQKRLYSAWSKSETVMADK